MRLFHKIFTIACLTSAALMPAAAHADDAPAAVKAFLDNLQRQTSAKTSYEALKTDGSGNVTITNLSLTKEAKGEDPAMTLKTAAVAFSGISDKGSSLYQIDKASFTDTSVQLTGKDLSLSVTIPAASAEGWYIRALPAAPTAKDELLSSMTFASKMSSGKVNFSTAGQTLTIDSIDTTWAGDPATAAGKFTLKVNNFAIPESAMALIDPTGLMKQLGYPGLNFDLATEADLVANGENLNNSFNVTLTGRDMGSFTVSAAVDDLPVAAYAEMVKSEAAGKGINFDALAPQLQNVVIKSASLRFNDSSITRKLLPVAAAMQGMDEKVLVASIPPTVQLTLIQFQNEALTKQAVDAVTKFLADPKSLMLSMVPASPLKVSDFNGFDPAKPGDAITRMGLSVTANE